MRIGALRRPLLKSSFVVLPVLAGGVATRLTPTENGAIVFGIAVVLLTPLVIRAVQRRLDVFEPIVVFALAFGVMFVVRPSVILTTHDFMYVRPTHVIDISSQMTPMLLVALTGAVSFVVGYEIPLGSRFAEAWRPPIDRINVGTAVTVSLVVAGLGALSFALFVLFAGKLAFFEALLQGRSLSVQAAIQGGSSYLWIAWQVMIPASLILIALGRAQQRTAVTVAGVLVAGLSLIRQVPLGARITLLPLLGGLLVLYYVRKGRRPSWLTILTVSLVSLVVSATLVTARNASTRQSEGTSTVFLRTVSNPASVFFPLTDGGDAEMAPALAAAMTVVPGEIHRKYGWATVGDFVTRPIPRRFWPGKPLPPREQVIQALYPYEYRIHAANPEFSPMLGFYMDFGVLGVALGLFCYGLVFRTMYAYFCRFRSHLQPQVLFALAVPLMFVALRDSLVDTTIRSMLIIGPVFWIFRSAGVDR